MLVLSRKAGEDVVIGGRVVVTVVAVRGRRVRLGIAAPPQVPVRREEVGPGPDPGGGPAPPPSRGPTAGRDGGPGRRRGGKRRGGCRKTLP